MSKSLLFREVDRASTRTWAEVRAMFTGEDMNDAATVRTITKIIHRRKNPALLHNGRKP